MLGKLIIEGEELKKHIINDEIESENFSIWLYASIHYIETYYLQSVLTNKFIKEFEAGTQKNLYYLNNMINILKGLKKIEDDES